MTEEINFGNDLDVKTEDFEFEYIKGDDTDFQVEGRDPRTTPRTIPFIGLVLACESLVQASFRRMADYCDRIQLVKITEELNSEDFVCKMEETEDEMKTNDDSDDFFVYNCGLDQRPRQKARSRNG